MASGPPWLQRWNFIERARLERQLGDAFERGEPIGHEDEEYPFDELTCRRCRLEMKPTMFAMLD